MIDGSIYYCLGFIKQIHTSNVRNKTWHIMGAQSMLAEVCRHSLLTNNHCYQKWKCLPMTDGEFTHFPFEIYSKFQTHIFFYLLIKKALMLFWLGKSVKYFKKLSDLWNLGQMSLIQSALLNILLLSPSFTHFPSVCDW